MTQEQLAVEESPYRLAVLQRLLMPYRVPLFDALATRCRGISVFAGDPAPWESQTTAPRLHIGDLHRGRNRYLLRGRLEVHWQEGLSDWLESWQPEILVAEANPRCLSTRRAAAWMHERGHPVLGWGWGTHSTTQGLERVRDYRRRRYLGMFDGMLAYSSRAAAQYRAAGLPEDLVFVCKNAAASQPSSPPPDRASSLSGSPIVLFVGRLIHGKQVEVLVRACALLKRMRPDLGPELRIVGEGEAMDSLTRLTQDTYPETRLLGAMHGPELSEQFRMADLFVMPGGSGLAVHEAMSYGLPVIVGGGDGTQEDLVRPENGWHLPAPDADLLAATLNTALSDVRRLRAMGAASHRIVDREINFEQMTDVFVRAINRTCDRIALAPTRADHT